MRPPFAIVLAATLCLSGCDQPPATPRAQATPPAQAAQTAQADPYLNAELPDYVSQLKGDYDLWQDGEGGLSCEVTLGQERTIGGYTLNAQDTCTDNLALAADPQAWMVRDDGKLVIIDATRRVLLQMYRLPDGTYKDPRDGDYVNAVLLTPRQDSKD